MIERKCANPECGKDISYRHFNAIYCEAHGYKGKIPVSYAAIWERLAGPKPTRECSVCGRDISKLNRDAIYCGNICRSAARKLRPGNSERANLLRQLRIKENGRGHVNEVHREWCYQNPDKIKAINSRLYTRAKAAKQILGQLGVHPQNATLQTPQVYLQILKQMGIEL